MLVVHRASRGDVLAVGLAEMLRGHVADPFAAEVVSVPTRGVERWLAQQLSGVLGARPGHEDGICANIEFPFPATIVGRALTAASGIDPKTDPWLPDRLVWPLLRVVDTCLDEPWLSLLAAHLGASDAPDSERHDRRFSTVRHLADLFDHYSVHRPALLTGWAEGVVTTDSSDEAWQAELWRRVRQQVDVPSPAERLAPACERLVADPGLAELPDRLSVFGLTRLPASHLAVLSALGAGREVHLWLLHPSQALWSEVAESSPDGIGPRRLDSTATFPSNPLLRTWGRDAREMQVVLAAAGASDAEALEDPKEPGSLLGRVQAAIRGDLAPGTTERPALDPADRSVQLHACHGRVRQVEVVRDAIEHMLVSDPTLEPRDFIIMCPDIEEFAPHIHATFGSGSVGGGPDLHVRLADRSLRQTNPVLGAIARLLEMSAGRVTASDLLDLAGLEPVRARFEFDDDELARVETWVRAAGVRWGLDAEWRAPYSLSSLAHGTWAAGMDRIMSGVAMSEEAGALIGDVLPLDDVDSGDIALAGRLAEFVDRAGEALRSFSALRSLGEWIAAIGSASSQLFATPAGNEWQASQLQRILDDLCSQAGDRDTTDMRPAEVRALLADRLRGVPTRANFRTGHLTVCTLVPMRSVPHRVVCLLGLDDGAFPRRTVPDGDDLLAMDPWVGDKDPRNEDRQLLLDALLAARETLIITYSGHNEHTNAPQPPAVPVGELLDVIDATVSSGNAEPARKRIVVDHPLQPFDPKNFVNGAVIAGRPWSFDQTALAGARRSREQRSPLGEGVGLPLPPMATDLIEIEDLVRFVEHPVKAFMRQRLGIHVRGDWPEPGDDIDVELDALQKWQVGDRLLSALLAGTDSATCIRSELGRGNLPPGRLGERVVDELMHGVQAIVDAAPAPARYPTAVDASVELSLGPTVRGTVTDVFGHEVRLVTYSRLAPKHRLGAWVRLLALSAVQPDQAWTSVSVGRPPTGAGVAVATAGPLGHDAAERGRLAKTGVEVLSDLYLRGMRQPLPLAARTSMAWARAVTGGKDAERAARAEWVTSDWGFPKEDRDPAHVLAWGGELGWEDFVGFIPEDDETGPGWDGCDSRAGRLAMRLWEQLLHVEALR